MSTRPQSHGDTFRRLSEQAQRLPNRPNASTLWRWANKGVHGVKLETVKVGGVTLCSDEALERFLRAINDTPQASPVKAKRSRKERRESARRAEQILASAGI